MKKKLSLLIVSCFLLSTPCFAFDGHHKPHHKNPPPKPHHHIERHIQPNIIYYNNDGYGYTTSEDVEIAKIQSITDIITSILD